MSLAPKPHHSVSDSPESPQTSTPQPKQLTPQQGVISAGWGHKESRGWGYCFPQADDVRRGVLHLRNTVSVVWEDSAQGFLQLSPQLSPLGHKPQPLLT